MHIRNLIILSSVFALLACGDASSYQGAPEPDAQGHMLPSSPGLPLQNPGTSLDARASSLLAGGLGWDATAPGLDVNEVTFAVTCGLANGVFEQRFFNNGYAWERDKKGPSPDIPADITDACMWQAPEPPMMWADDGAIAFDVGGWTHALLPTKTPGKWFGHVTRDDRPAACDGALAAHHIIYPVALSMVLK